MLIVAALIGVIIPMLSGWCLVRLLEGSVPVLDRCERWVMGWVVGTTLTMFLTFVATAFAGMALDRLGMIAIQLSILIIVGCLGWKRKIFNFQFSIFNSQQAESSNLSRWLKGAIAILGVWTVVKIAAGAAMLLGTPIYLDDAMGNWNLRGRVFFIDQALTLALPSGNGVTDAAGVSSYPPTVPLVKTWLAVLAGQWNEGLINLPHLLWYLSLIVLLFYALRRVLPLLWSLLGVYLFTGLPLPLIHGTNPYGDTFLSVHIFLALSLLFAGMRQCDADRRQSFLRLGALCAGLLVFTKNEALLIYLPPLLLMLVISLIVLKARAMDTKYEIRKTIASYAFWIIAIGLPWLIFKWSHGLSFGNAKGISGMTIAWQPGVLKAVAVNTFLEGNWIFLPVLLIALLLVRFRRALSGSLANLTLFLVIVYCGQLLLYLFTPLSVEALWQTGYARGLVHLAPLAVLLVTILLWDLLKKDAGDAGDAEDAGDVKSSIGNQADQPTS